VSSFQAVTATKHVLTVQDVAELLKVCPRTVLNMAKRGDIPASRIGHLWRFDETTILQWLRDKSEGQPQETAPATPRAIPDSIVSLLTPAQIRIEKSVADRREVLEDLASLAVRSGHVTDYPDLVRSLEEREEMFSTAVSDGIAFPHPRRPIMNLREPVLAALVVKSGVVFGAPGASLTHLFLLFCAPGDVSHVRILARLAQIFHKRRKMVAQIRLMNTAEEVLAELLAAEKEIMEKLIPTSR